MKVSKLVSVQNNKKVDPYFFFSTQKRFKEFTVFDDQPDNRRKEKTSYPNIEDRKRD